MSDTQRPKSIGDILTAREINEDLPYVFTAGEAISSTPLAVYVKSSDGKVYLTNALFTSTPYTEYGTPSEPVMNFIGFAKDVATGDGSPVAVQIKGVVSGFSGLTKGEEYHLAGTPGTITTDTPMTVERKVGIAVSATEIKVYNKRKYLRKRLTGYSTNTSYQARFDGFLTIYGTIGANDTGGFSIKVGPDSNSDDMTNIYSQEGDDPSNINVVSGTVSIMAGEYFRIQQTGDGLDSYDIFFQPLY